jgi:hypothetical protein
MSDKLPKKTSLLKGHFFNSETGNQTFVDWQTWDRDLTGHGLQDYQPGWQPGPDVTVTNTDVPPPPHANANGFNLSSKSLSAATLDLERMKVDPATAFTGWLDADSPLALSLRSTRLRGGSVTIDGQPATASRSGNTLTVQVPAGTHVLRVAPR